MGVPDEESVNSYCEHCDINGKEGCLPPFDQIAGVRQSDHRLELLSSGVRNEHISTLPSKNAQPTCWLVSSKLSEGRLEVFADRQYSLVSSGTSQVQIPRPSDTDLPQSVRWFALFKVAESSHEFRRRLHRSHLRRTSRSRQPETFKWNRPCLRSSTKTDRYWILSSGPNPFTALSSRHELVHQGKFPSGA